MDAWNPWRELRRRGSEVEFWFADLDETRGLWVRAGGRDQIFLSDRLRRRERREVLTHELIHAERGIGSPAATPATMAKEEHFVRAESWLRLVPPRELGSLIRRHADLGLPVDERSIAECFDLSGRGVEEFVAIVQASDRWRDLC